MSTIAEKTLDDGIMDTVGNSCKFIEFLNTEEETELERSLLDACRHAENVDRESEKKQSSTSIVNEEKDQTTSNDKLNNKNSTDNERQDNISIEKDNSAEKKASEDAPEHLTEPNMDYTLDDVIEIYDISDEEDDPVEHVVSTIIKEQEKGSRIKVEKMLNANEVNIINDDDDDDNEELLSVFNDHNYISQETLTPSASDIQSNNDLRQNIIDHIVKKRSMEMSNGNGNASTFNDEESCNSSTDSAIEDNAKKEIEDFVDQILEGKIENFVKKEIKTEACIITEDFIQNVFNAVADEDAAEYAAEASLSEQQQSEQQNLNKKFNNETTTDGGQRLAEVITYNINSKTDNRSDRNLNQLVNELSLNPSSCTENHCDKVAIEKDMQIDQNDGDGMEFLDNENGNPMTNSTASTTESRFESNGTLPDYCSEPLEAIPLEERFQMDIDEEIDFLEQFNNDLPPSETTNFAEDALQLKNISESENCVEENGNGVAKPPAVTPEQKEAQNEEETTKQNEEVVVSVTKTVEEEEKENADSSSRSEFNRPLMETAATAATAEESNKITNDADNPNLYTDFQSSLEEKLESMDRAMDEAEAVCPKSLVLEEFCALIKEMHDDCEKFSAATTSIDLRLGSYINDKLEIMRQLARNCDMSFAITERSTQTGPELSRKLLKKLNKEDKKELLNSSDDSSSHSGASGASSDDEHSNLLSSDRRAKRKHKHHNRSSPLSSRGSRSEERPTAEDTQEQVQTEKPSDELQETIINIESVYDDGIVLSKYLRSNVFSSPRLKSEDDKISNGSVTRSRLPSRSSELDENDEGAAKSKQESAGGDKEKTKIKENKTDTRDEKDKEIERLINLDGLMRRPIKAGNSKQSDVEKLKTKPPNLKKTNGIEEFLENDLDKESLASEESANEDEEEVITEKQYLKRFNEDLKKQLLNDSSNDSTADEKSDEELGTVLSDESESGNRSPLVDKFLKTYNVDESDTDADAEMPLDDAPSKVLLETTPKCEEPNKPDDDDQDQLQKEPKEKSAGNSPDSDNSDCELLNDNFVYRKRSQPKSLEKILIEAEKRKKIQKLDEDLISLSSESYSSDVEAVEIEPADAGKKRAIKAMLRPDQLQRETVKAQKSESDRIRRLEKKQTLLTKALAENKNLNVNEELVLDYSEETKTFIKVHSELVKHLKPHQRDGVKFMYDSCYGGVDSVKKNHGSGCILAHCMGLGKTLQLIALMHTVISHKELKTHKILVLCPKSTVMNWADEIERWLLPLRTKNIKLFTFNDTSDINDKLGILRDWSLSKYQKAGCLLIGYEAFRTLVFYHKYKNRNNLDPTRLEKIRDLVNEYLLQPGADLVVCDEGHIIKNSKSAISLAVAEIKTQKRIVLTGTPIQNNLKEYYSMVNFIKPLFLGTEKEFANLYANPIKNGQHKDSSKKDIKVMKQRSFVLHKKLSKFVQRKEAELLKTFLPKKFEYVLFIPMTNVQNKLYERILETINSRQDNRGRGLITDYTCLRKIWTHPKVLEDAWKNAINQKFKRDARKQANSDDDQPDDIYDSQTGIMSVKNDWWRHLIDAKDLESILPSNKLRTMFEILRMCEENGDKCLIFSAFVAVLNVVEYFFKKLAEGHKETLSELNLSQGLRSTWEPHKDYFRLDGKTPKTTRHEMIKRFNHPNNTRARVFLISAKAGGQGINLTGANRVIILDTSWNPSNDQQNIFRIFRLGQKKNCYIYRLLALGTMEEKVYSRSVTKQAMSFRVMDVQQIDRHYSMAELAELYTLTIPNYAERPTPILPQDTILANLLRSYPDLVYKYHEHDSLLENKVEQELSEQEKIDAWQAYESDLHMNSQAAHMDEMQNKMAAQGHMQNYMGGLGSPMQQGLNLQALLNFRNVNAAAAQSNAASSYINSPILQQYSKYSMANQQYLDLVNSYRQYSTPEGSAAFNASVAAAYSGMYPGVAAASLPPHLANSANASLNALNDLSMYGLGLNSSTSSAAAAAVAAAAAATSLASTPTNSSSMYATPTGMPGTQPVAGAGALYSNQAASYYQTLQQMAYAGSAASSSSNLMNNSYVHSPASFQAPKQTQPPQQSNARKSTTPEMPPYRTSGGSMSLSPRPTASAMPPSIEISKSNTVHNPISNTKSTSSTSGNINYNNKNNNELINSGSGRRQTDSLNRTNAKATSASSNTAISASAAAKTTTARMETTNSVSQNSQTTSAASTSTTFATTSSSISTSKPFTNTTKHTAQAPSTKSSDPQIRVKDMGQLCANTNRSSTLPAAAAAVVREIKGNSYSNNSNQKNTMDVRSSSKQHQVMDNRLINTTTATSATDLLKARSEMQIIPTTSPPGTASISKQLSEISPSISLTAVRNNNKSSGSGSTSNSFPKTSTVVTSGAMNNNNNNTTTARDSTTTSSTKVSSMLSNRKQTSGINALPPPTKSNIPSSAMNVIGQNNSNLTISTKKPSSTNLVQSKKNATPTKQSFVTMTPTSGTSGSGGVKTTKTQNAVNVVNNNKNINDNNQYTSESAVRAKLASVPSSTLSRITTPTPTPTTTTTPSAAALRNAPNILRSNIKKKAPSPILKPLSVQRNTVSNINTSTNAIQSSSSSSNQSSIHVNSKPTTTPVMYNTTKNVVPSNLPQIFNNNNKTNTSAARNSYSPTTTLVAQQQRTSRTASPAANASTIAIEKVISNNKIRVNKHTITPLETTTTTTTKQTESTAFPVQLQRSNSALGASRAVTPISITKITSDGPSSGGNRSKSSNTIITPQISSVTSLNTSKPSTSGAASSATSNISHAAATAMRVAALKKLTTSNSGKMNTHPTKPLQSSSLSTKHSRQNEIVTSKASIQQSQQSAQSNGGQSVNVNTAPSRSLTGDSRITGLNIRPIIKTASPTASAGMGSAKRSSVAGVPMPSAGGWMGKQFVDRKRKAPETLNKESGNLSKRPKDS